MIIQNLQNIFHLTIGIHIAISIAIIALGFLHRKDRVRTLPLLYVINLGIFLVASFVGSNYFDISKTLDLVTFFGYVIIASYVISIEIPGYLLLSRYDDKLLDALQNIRRKIISLNYDIVKISDLEILCQENKKQLETIFVYDILEEFIKSCKTIKNLDKSLYEVTLKEIGERIGNVSEQSKHPFPKLIEIMSLAGISFLLGQFLNHFFT